MQGSKRRVSIGLPVYNGAKYIRTSLDSLLGQTFGEFELIICDNDSNDETEKICREYAKRDSRIRYTLAHFVTGDCRGSHVMPVMPVAINTAVTGPFCLPIVSCLAFSMDGEGSFAREHVDVFGNVAWDQTRLKVQAKADEWRRQGFIGPTMASEGELSRTGMLQTLAALERDFELPQDTGLGALDLDPVGHAPGRSAGDF